MRKLHPKQAAMLKLLRDNIDNPLTIRDLGASVGISSPGVIYHHLQQLEKKGFLKRNPDNPKDYIILDTPEKAIVYLNKYGLAKCGPNGYILDGNPVDRLAIPSILLKFPAADAFVVEAMGDSMYPTIKPGDIIIAQKTQTPEHKQFIVCTHDGTAMIKQYSNLNGLITLHSVNTEEYNPIIANESLKIAGVVRNIISSVS